MPYATLQDAARDALSAHENGAHNVSGLTLSMLDAIRYGRDSGAPNQRASAEFAPARVFHGIIGYFLGLGLGPREEDIATLREILR